MAEIESPMTICTNYDTNRIECHMGQTVVSLTVVDAMELGRLLIQKAGWLLETGGKVHG
jgi:hypothetical protein